MIRYYKIAGLTVEMDSYGRTEAQAEPYLIEKNKVPDIVIVSRKEELKKKYPTVSDDDAEYLCTGSSFYRQLLDYNGMMLHSSAVVVDRYAYLFAANSGTGKSTHTKLWLEVFREKAFILNDDKPALRLENGKWYAYGTPWSGKNDLSVDIRVPVAGIALLERGEENIIQPFSGAEAIFEVFKQVNRPKDAGFRIKILTLLDRLFKDVPIWRLQCNMEPEAAMVSYEAMRPKSN